jgi:hypothetical protein
MHLRLRLPAGNDFVHNDDFARNAFTILLLYRQGFGKSETPNAAFSAFASPPMRSSPLALGVVLHGNIRITDDA